MIEYVTVGGDVLDEVVYRFYGATSGYVEAVLEANRHIEEYGDILPADVRILIPDVNRVSEKKEVTLWD